MYIPNNPVPPIKSPVYGNKAKASRAVTDENQKERRRMPDRRKKKTPWNGKERRKFESRRRRIQAISKRRHSNPGKVLKSNEVLTPSSDDESTLGQTIDVSA